MIRRIVITVAIPDKKHQANYDTEEKPPINYVIHANRVFHVAVMSDGDDPVRAKPIGNNRQNN